MNRVLDLLWMVFLIAGLIASLLFVAAGFHEYFSESERMGHAMKTFMFHLMIGQAGCALFGIPLFLKIRSNFKKK